MTHNMAVFTWNNDLYKKLVEEKHSTEYTEKFIGCNGNGQKVKKVWNELAKKLHSELNGIEAKNKYNYLLKMYRIHDAQARSSGSGSVKWKHYESFKQFFKSDPSIEPVFLLDSDSINITSDNIETVENSKSVTIKSELSNEEFDEVCVVNEKRRKTNQEQNNTNKLIDELKALNQIKKENYENIERFRNAKLQLMIKDNEHVRKIEKMEKDVEDVKQIVNQMCEQNKTLQDLLMKFIEKK